MHAMIPVADPLSEQVREAIAQSPFLRQRNLRFEAAGGCVILRGTVASYYQKQMAQETLRRLAGVEHIANELEVAWA